MLEVHPPEHAPHSVRDFFLHIFTITIGLLIALGLESLVEWRHHVHVGHEAARNLRMELDENAKDLDTIIQITADEQRSYKAILVFLHSRERNEKADLHGLRPHFRMATLKDASWQTASATGALTYIPYDELQRIASAYQLQKQYMEVQSAALPFAVALAGSMSTEDPTDMSPASATVAVAQVHALMANVETMRSVGVDTAKVYAEALKE